MSESINFFQSLFYIQYSKTGNSYLFGINNNQTFQILTVLSPLREKLNFSVSWDLNQKVHSGIKPAN